MDNDQSIADTVASVDYKWVKDSWVSQNHPTVSNSADRSTFVRNMLDTARKEQVRRMAELLDNYESPVKRSLHKSVLDHDASLLLPQATSSPRLTRKTIDSSHKTSHDAFTPTHRSNSPSQTTSQTPSWQKHSMRPSSALALASPEAAGNIDHLDSAGFRLTQHEPKNDAPTNPQERRPHSRSAHISPEEGCDSSEFDHRTQQQQWDVTPSPVRFPQHFYTPSVDEHLLVESLQIASLDVDRPPSARLPTSIAGLSLTNKQPTSSDKQQRRSLEAVPDSAQYQNEDLTKNDSLVYGNMTRSVSPVGSDLSRVDSQTESLQRAISTALNEKREQPSRRADAPAAHIPLEEAIATRYRQSRSDRSHNTTFAPTHSLRAVDSRNLKPKSTNPLPAEPLKPSSPLLGRDPANEGPRWSNGDLPSKVKEQEAAMRRPEETREVDQVPSPTSKSPSGAQVTEMLTALAELRNECDRRGRTIEDLSRERSVQLQLVAAEERNRALEERLAWLEQRPVELQAKKPAAPLYAPDGSISLQNDCPEPQNFDQTRNATRHSSSASRGPGSMLGDKTFRIDASRSDIFAANETLQEKVLRWGQDLRSGQNVDEEGKSMLGPRQRAQRMLINTPAILSAANNEKVRNLSTLVEPTSLHGLPSSDIRSSAVLMGQAPYPLGTPNGVPDSGLGQSTVFHGPQDKADDLTHLVGALRQAEEEIARFKRMNTAKTAPRPISSVRPMTAAMMPDASDASMCPEEKLYNRLRLADVDRMDRNELGNFLKNILIQLDVPLSELAKTVTNLGHTVTTSQEQIPELLIAETCKLREFAENIHATLYGGSHIEGVVTSRQCLSDMYGRVGKLQRSYCRRRSGRAIEH